VRIASVNYCNILDYISLFTTQIQNATDVTWQQYWNSTFSNCIINIKTETDMQIQDCTQAIITNLPLLSPATLGSPRNETYECK